VLGTLLAFISYFAMRFFVAKFQSDQVIMQQLRKVGIIPDTTDLPVIPTLDRLKNGSTHKNGEDGFNRIERIGHPENHF
jgi:hypothetical protein